MAQKLWHSRIMAILGYIILGVAALPYIAVPILIWSTQRFTSSMNLRRMQENFLPKDVLREFQLFTAPLAARCFEPCFDTFTHDEFLGLRFYHRVLLSRIQKTWAICTAICDEEGSLQRQYIELKTQLANQISFATHNSDLIGAPINSGKRKMIALPPKTGVDVLLNIHLLELAKLKSEEGIVEPNSETAMETFQQFLRDDHEDQLELGAIYFDENEKIFRPTWAGAFLIGWYSMWPMTLVRRLNSNLKVRSLMKQLASANA